jgi:hypothetical protein
VTWLAEEEDAKVSDERSREFVQGNENGEQFEARAWLTPSHKPYLLCVRKAELHDGCLAKPMGTRTSGWFGCDDQTGECVVWVRLQNYLFYSQL